MHGLFPTSRLTEIAMQQIFNKIITEECTGYMEDDKEERDDVGNVKIQAERYVLAAGTER